MRYEVLKGGCIKHLAMNQITECSRAEEAILERLALLQEGQAWLVGKVEEIERYLTADKNPGPLEQVFLQDNIDGLPPDTTDVSVSIVWYKQVERARLEREQDASHPEGAIAVAHSFWAKRKPSLGTPETKHSGLYDVRSGI